MAVIVTGGAGFIGSALVRHLIEKTNYDVINVDKLTYAGNLESLASVAKNPRYKFEKADIADMNAMRAIFERYQPEGVFHLAAESHVDRSIDGARPFIETNIVGTFTMLEVARDYWRGLPSAQGSKFRFLHISTDEVFGSLGETGLFEETSPYQPNSPYSASKAASDHLVRAWYHTYGMPVLVTNCSNNYGPFHFPEKLIPLIITNALDGLPLPVYGNGVNVRDWLFVEDHVKALTRVFERGSLGETYNVGGNNEKKNIEVVEAVCSLLDEVCAKSPHRPFNSLIKFVTDRPGHDARYAIDASKIKNDLGWEPEETFETGLRKTVLWYLENEWWWRKLKQEKYQGQRLGMKV